jgi:hypothetical protein
MGLAWPQWFDERSLALARATAEKIRGDSGLSYGTALDQAEVFPDSNPSLKILGTEYRFPWMLSPSVSP